MKEGLLMELLYKENAITAEEVLRFQQKMGWIVDPPALWRHSLAHTLYAVGAYCGGELVAMDRLLGDGAMYWYINDVFVQTEYQGHGIGRAVMNQLLAYIKEHGVPGTVASVHLFCAKGKEGFYEKLGFRPYPHEDGGPGMGLELPIG